jgi:hypothetical protein
MNDATPLDNDTTGDATTAVPVAEAAARLGITSDAVRARIRRGKLQAVKRENVWHVIMPAASLRTERSDETTDATKPDSDTTGRDNDATEPAADDALIDRLQGENDYLRSVVMAAYDQDTTGAPDARLISKLESEVAYLREELTAARQQAAAERERADVLQREALQRLEGLIPIALGPPGSFLTNETEPARMEFTCG